MKKRLCLNICLLALFVLMPSKVLAEGDIIVSPVVINIDKGETATITVRASDAAGRLDVTIEDSTIVSATPSNIFVDNSSETITITGEKAGTTSVIITATDVTSYDDEDMTGEKITIRVIVNDSGNNNGNGNQDEPIVEPGSDDDDDSLTLTIKYIDQDGNFIGGNTYITKNLNEEYKVTCPSDKKYNNVNYILDGKPDNASGTMKEDTTVICKYTGKSKQTSDSFIFIIIIAAAC